MLLLRVQSGDGSGDSTTPITSLRVECLEAEPFSHQNLENPANLTRETHNMQFKTEEILVQNLVHLGNV